MPQAGRVILVTLIVILPTNRRLLILARGKDSPEAARSLCRRGKLQAVRGVLSFISFLVFLCALSQRSP
jgi:hypothetical protein